MCRKQTLQISFWRKIDKEVKYDWKLQEEWKTLLWGLWAVNSLSLPRILSVGWSLLCLKGSKLFLSQGMNESPQAGCKCFLSHPLPFHFPLASQLWHCPGSYSPERPKSQSWSTHVHSTVTCSRLCPWVTLVSWVLDFQVFSLICDNAEQQTVSMRLRDVREIE